MHIDYKYTTWGRLYFKDESKKDEIIKKLEEGCLPSELYDDTSLGFNWFEPLGDTAEYISPNENDGSSTIELFESESYDVIWDNSYESEIKRKNKQS